MEREGIRRALASARDADIVVFMRDATAPRPEEEDAADLLPPEEGGARGKARVTLTVVNKIDLAPGAPTPHHALSISAKTGQGLDALKTALVRIAEEIYGAADTPLITRARHRQEIQRAQSALMAFLTSAEAGEQTELAAEHLRQASDALGRLTGRLDVEDVLGQIFSEFCIGK